MPTYPLKKLSEICGKASSNISQNQLSHNEGEFSIYGAGGLIKNVNFYHQQNEYIGIVKDGAGVGRLVLLPAQSSVIGTMQYILPGEGINRKFLYYSLLKIDFLKYKQGSTIPHIYFKDYSREEIPLPPLSVQEEIVAKLDTTLASIDEAKTKTQQALSATRELWASKLEEAFFSGDGWEQRTLKDVCKDFGRGKSKHRPRNDKKLYGGEYPFIQTGDIRNSQHFITEYSQTYNSVGLSQSKLWPKGTICITIAANIAETGILDFDACFPDSVIGMVINPQITEINYVAYLLQYYKTRIQAKGKGSAQANINMATFEDEYFPFPPLDEQSRIVAHLDAVRAETDRLASLYEQKLRDLDELRRSVLQEAFTPSD